MVLRVLFLCVALFVGQSKGMDEIDENQSIAHYNNQCAEWYIVETINNELLTVVFNKKTGTLFGSMLRVVPRQDSRFIFKQEKLSSQDAEKFFKQCKELSTGQESKSRNKKKLLIKFTRTFITDD